MRFKYKNLNPLGCYEKDCVCRAIALATNIDGNIMDIWDCSNEVVDIAWEAH